MLCGGKSQAHGRQLLELPTATLDERYWARSCLAAFGPNPDSLLSNGPEVLVAIAIDE